MKTFLRTKVASRFLLPLVVLLQINFGYAQSGPGGGPGNGNGSLAPGELAFQNAVLVSGIAGADGAVYRFPSVNNDLDALLKINGRSSSEVSLNNLDLTNTGFAKAFQPQIKYNGNLNVSTSWWMEFEVSFVNKNTMLPATVSSFSMTALDIDGNNNRLRETNSFYNPASYILEGASTLGVSNLVGNVLGILTNVGKTFTGPENEYAGIDTSATNVMTTLSYVNTGLVTFRMGATTNGSVSSANRMHSVWFRSFNYTSPVITTLPLELLSFTASLEKKTVSLNWTTVNEVNVSHFIVEKSLDGRSFNEAGLVMAYGNTNENKKYWLNDDVSELSSGILYYRLLTYDIDGKMQISETRIVRMADQSNTVSLTTYPNPVSDQLRITVPASWQNRELKIELLNTSGQSIKVRRISNASQTETITMSELPNGVYVIRASIAGETASQKIIKR